MGGIRYCTWPRRLQNGHSLVDLFPVQAVEQERCCNDACVKPTCYFAPKLPVYGPQRKGGRQNDLRPVLVTEEKNGT